MSHSVGCATCKTRRLKCDGALPNCGRCRHANRICFPFQQKETKFSFVIEKPPRSNPSPSRRTETHEGQKHAPATELQSMPKSPFSGNNFSQWIPSSLTISLEDQALSYYFYHHVIPPTGVIEAAQGHDMYFSLIWKLARRDSAFCLAILALSYSAFGKAKRNHVLSKASKFMYFHAVTRIQKSLQDPVDSCSDETLLAIMVLSFYELTSWEHRGGKGNLNRQHELSQYKSRGMCHIDGATAVLEARQQRDPLNERNLDIDKLVRRQAVRAALHRSTGVPRWLEDGELFRESGFSLELDRWTVSVTRIQRDAQTLLPLSSSSNAKFPAILQVKGLIEETINLDNEILLWTTRLGPEWCYQTYAVDSVSSRATSYSGTTHVYSSLSHAVVWNAYRTTRIILKSIMIKLLRLLETYRGCDEDLSIQVAMSGIQDLINEVCASIPFFTGEARDTIVMNNGNGKILVEHHKGVREEMKASEMAYLSFPLYTIIDNFAASGISTLQQQWIRRSLLSVSHATSYTILEQFACS